MHDKLFFFFDSEWVRIALPIVTAATVPTPAFQNYVLQQHALGGTDSVTGSVYQPFPQSVPFYQKMFSLYGNTNVTPLTVLGCPFDVGGVAPAIANDGNGCANKSCQLFQSGFSWYGSLLLKQSSDLSAADAYFGPPYCEAGVIFSTLMVFFAESNLPTSTTCCNCEPLWELVR